jgi:hypothetical protein
VRLGEDRVHRLSQSGIRTEGADDDGREPGRWCRRLGAGQVSGQGEGAAHLRSGQPVPGQVVENGGRVLPLQSLPQIDPGRRGSDEVQDPQGDLVQADEDDRLTGRVALNPVQGERIGQLDVADRNRSEGLLIGRGGEVRVVHHGSDPRMRHLTAHWTPDEGAGARPSASP